MHFLFLYFIIYSLILIIYMHTIIEKKNNYILTRKKNIKLLISLVLSLSIAHIFQYIYIYIHILILINVEQ
jgi:hypothetical protein